MEEKKVFKHDLKVLIDACGIDRVQFQEHDDAANAEFLGIVHKAGHITVSQQVELFEKYFTQHELAFLLGQVAAYHLLLMGKRMETEHNTAMMFG